VSVRHVNVFGRPFGFPLIGGYFPLFYTNYLLTTSLLMMPLWYSMAYRRPYWACECGEYSGGGGRGGGGRSSAAYRSSGSQPVAARRRPPADEHFPLVVLDVAKSDACNKLEERVGVHQKLQTIQLEAAAVELAVWDAPLQEAMLSTRPSSHRSVAAAVVLYDTCDRASFEAAKQWCTRAEQLAADEEEDARCFHVVLVGVPPPSGTEVSGALATTEGSAETKRQVTEEEAAEYGSTAGLPMVMETPLRTQADVLDLFTTVAQLVLYKVAERRQLQHAREAAMVEVQKQLTPEGWFAQIDSDKLLAAVRHAESVGVAEEQLEIAWTKLRKAGHHPAPRNGRASLPAALENVQKQLEPGFLKAVDLEALLQAVKQAEAAGGHSEPPLAAARARLRHDAKERVWDALHPAWFAPIEPAKLLAAVRHAEAMGVPMTEPIREKAFSQDAPIDMKAAWAKLNEKGYYAPAPTPPVSSFAPQGPPDATATPPAYSATVAAQLVEHGGDGGAVDVI